MELSIEQQILEYWNKAQKVLIALPENSSVDKICSALALRSVLKKMQKQADIVCNSVHKSSNWDFLNEPLNILAAPADQNILVVNLDTSKAKLDELSYESEDSSVKIFLKPKDGLFSPNDIKVSVGGSGYDLIVVIGAQNLELLGNVYENNSQIFFNVPKINLDINPANEYHGTINLVEVTASSASELMARLIDSLEPGIVDENIATVLMAGIIAQTHSFQGASTTPKTLSLASRLIAQGARQQDIIKTLYKTKNFALLKLWGRALARIKTAQNGTFLYSFITESDFAKTELPITVLPEVLSELIDNVSGFQTMALMGQQNNNVTLLLAGLPHTNITQIAQKISSNFSSVNLSSDSHLYQVVQLTLNNSSIEEVEAQLLAAVV